MASSGAATDPERKEAYFLRLDLLIVKEGTAILRARFDHSVPPQTLHQKLNENNVLKTIKYGLSNNFISKSQYNLLYPQGGPPSSKNFDVSLLVYLLRNICGMNRNSKWWGENDNSKIPNTVIDEEADIVRIRNMRNQMHHKHVASLEQAEFDTMWDLAERAMLRLAAKYNIPDQMQKLNELKERRLDLVTEEMRSMRVNTEIFLQDFCNENYYVKTATFERARKHLQEKQIVILTGHPGEGKTTMASRLALEFSLPRNCLKLACPLDWRRIDLSLKLFDTIIIDDIFGEGALDQKMVGDWRVYLPEIERAAKAKAIRVIITSRHYIFEESKEELGSLPMFKEENKNVFLLTSIDLTHDEKTEILRIQASKNDKEIPVYILKACIEASKGRREMKNDFLFGFPECASMFVRSEKMLQKGAAFFRKPASFFKRYLEDLYRGKEKDKFLALVALWAKDSKWISRSELRNVKTTSEHMKKIAEIFDVKLDNNFLENMRLSLDSHVGGYLVLSKATGRYMFSHNVISDMVGLVIGKKKTEETLELCLRDFLMRYVTVEEPQEDDFKVIVEEEQFPCLAEKMINMLIRRNCNFGANSQSVDDFKNLRSRGERINEIKVFSNLDFGIIKHEVFNSRKFAKIFIDLVMQKDLLKDIFYVPVLTMSGYFLDYAISVKEIDLFLLDYAWLSGASVFAEEVVTRKILGQRNCNSSDLMLATHSRQRQSIEFLLKHGAEVTGDVLQIAARKSDSLLQRLLEEPGTVVDDRGNAINGNYPLIMCARNGLIEAVKCMIEFGANTSVQNDFKMTALHKAILYKHIKIIECLVEAGAPLDIKGGRFKRTPMHLAVDLNENWLVKYLLNKGASLRIKDYRGQYPIHIAAIRGFIPIVMELFIADPTQDSLRIFSYGKKSIIKGMSLFHIAVMRRNAELLDALIALQADPNVQDFYGQTPLFFAIKKKQVALGLKLIAYEKTDKQMPQKQGLTPLHAAIDSNQNHIAKVLAPYSNVNAKDKNGKTPLHVACEKANVDLIGIMLRKFKADPRIVTERGDTVYDILKTCQMKQPYLSEEAKQAEQIINAFDPDFANHLALLKSKTV